LRTQCHSKLWVSSFFKLICRKNESQDCLTLDPRLLFKTENASRLLFNHNLNVLNAHLDTIADGDNGNVTMLRMHVEPVEGTTANDETFQVLVSCCLEFCPVELRIRPRKFDFFLTLDLFDFHSLLNRSESSSDANGWMEAQWILPLKGTLGSE
jgi:hypothetical protein